MEQRPAPFKGVRIIDLSMMLAGPSGSMLMGDLGAEVIKVEPMDGDETRVGPPYFYAENMSAYYLSINRNKKSIVINLKSPEGRQTFYELVKNSDVVYDNYRPGVTERLQVDYETLKKYNPQIICCSISTYRIQRSLPRPARVRPHRPGRERRDVHHRRAGRVARPRGNPPGRPRRSGCWRVHGVLAAYIHRLKTGEGQRLEVSLLDGQVYLLTYIAQYYFHSGKDPGPHRSRAISPSSSTRPSRPRISRSSSSPTRTTISRGSARPWENPSGPRTPGFQRPAPNGWRTNPSHPDDGEVFC